MGPGGAVGSAGVLWAMGRRGLGDETGGTFVGVTE